MVTEVLGRDNRAFVGVDKRRESASDDSKFDAEVVRASFDQGSLLPGRTWNSEEEIEAFDAKMKKAPDLFPRYPIA
jgi:hypothetical protein